MMGPFFFSSRRRHTRCGRDWSSDVCSSDLHAGRGTRAHAGHGRGGVQLHRRSEEHTSELQSRPHLVCRLLLEKKKEGDMSSPESVQAAFAALADMVTRLEELVATKG